MARDATAVSSEDAEVATRVLHSAINTKGLPTKEAVAAWLESIGLFYDVRILKKVDDRFFFYADASHLCETVLTRYQCAVDNYYDRSRARIGRDGLDHVTLQFCISGSNGRREGGAHEQAGAGDLLIADLAQAQAMTASNLDSYNLTAPRRLLAPLLKAPDEQNLRVISGKAPLTALLRNHVENLHREAPRMSREEAEAVIRPTLELAAAAINMEVTEESTASVQLVLTWQIRRYIDSHITDHGLSAEAIAAAFGISTRRLYHLFEPYGGVSAYVTSGRLHRAREMLTDPSQQGWSIADIASHCGFAYRTNFARAFRNLFGVTPREVRAHAAEGRVAIDRHARGPSMWHWIRQLR
ncbi:helix-turn-helix domain-containing protein [Aquabacter sp. CN5-332]